MSGGESVHTRPGNHWRVCADDGRGGRLGTDGEF